MEVVYAVGRQLQPSGQMCCAVGYRNAGSNLVPNNSTHLTRFLTGIFYNLALKLFIHVIMIMLHSIINLIYHLWFINKKIVKPYKQFCNLSLASFKNIFL